MIKNVIENNENTLPNDKEIQVLKENFPACFKNDGSFDIERFKEYLNDKVAVTNEGYELKFLGKNYARLLASMDTTTVITPDEEHNNKPENINSENIYISGDNLDGLKHLLKSYAGQIKCIYIDPPYNTGSDGFVYNDSFNFTPEELATKLSIDEEQAKRILDLTKRGSASHSAWLMFMYPRLLLSRDLITKDGFIFISIDDNEETNLKIICDDIFGEENFIACLSVENNPKGRKNSDHISVSSEYCLIYGRKKDGSHFIENVPKPASDMELDENGNYVHNSGKRVLVGSNDFNDFVINEESDKNYSVYYNKESNTIKIKKEIVNQVDKDLLDNGYKKYCSIRDNKLVENTYTSQKFIELFDKCALDFADEKIYEKNYSDTIRMKSQLINKKYEAIVSGKKMDYSMELTTTGAGTYLKELFKSENVLFSAPKNIGFIQLLISLIDEQDFIVLDFFAGSSTTADAVMHLNCKNGKKIKYVMIQLPENLDLSYEKATGDNKARLKEMIEYLDSKNRNHTLDQISMERIILANSKLKDEYSNNNICGFKHYTLKEVSDETLDKLEEFKPNEQGLFLNNDLLHEFGTPTILTTWLVHDGYGFNGKVEELDFVGYKGYWCDKHLYLIHPELSKDAIAKIVEKFEIDGNFNPENIVLFGYSFLWTEIDELKINLNRLKETEKNLRINYDVRY